MARFLSPCFSHLVFVCSLSCVGRKLGAQPPPSGWHAKINQGFFSQLSSAPPRGMGRIPTNQSTRIDSAALFDVFVSYKPPRLWGSQIVTERNDTLSQSRWDVICRPSSVVSFVGRRASRAL